jgi:hypothetical protein
VGRREAEQRLGRQGRADGEVCQSKLLVSAHPISVNMNLSPSACGQPNHWCCKWCSCCPSPTPTPLSFLCHHLSEPKGRNVWEGPGERGQALTECPFCSPLVAWAPPISPTLFSLKSSPVASFWLHFLESSASFSKI